MKILIDTNIPVSHPNLLASLLDFGAKVYIGKTSADRESTSFYKNPQIEMLEVAPETFLFGESTFPIMFRKNTNVLERILHIISNGSFPKNRENLTLGQKNQLRDALIFESSTMKKCDYFCTNDKKAF